MSSPTTRNNGQDKSDLLINGLPNSAGDLVQQRFDYQNKYASIVALGMYEGKILYKEILCERLEDILAVRNDIKLEATQVKTRENGLPFSLSDEDIKKTISHFIDYEQTYPDKFAWYRIVSNCGFREGGKILDRKLVLDYLERKYQHEGSNAPRKFIQSLINKSHSDEYIITQVFRKLKLQKGPGLNDIDSRLESQVGRLQAIQDRAITYSQVRNMSKEIVELIKASAESKVENSLRDYITFVTDGLQKENSLVLETKRITTDKIDRIILDYIIRARNHNITIIKDIEDLSHYYLVGNKNIINIHGSQIDLLNTVSELDICNKGRWNKPIILITGKPGVGKSWFAYRYISGLMSRGTVVYKVATGRDIDKIHSEPLVENRKESTVPTGVFVLDDYWLSIGETISSSLTSDDVVELIKSYFVPENEYRTPLVLSMREETWEFITTGVDGKLDPSSLDQIVERITLLPPTYDESEKIVRSFYTSVDKGQPPFPHLTVNDIIKEKIIEKSNYSPVGIKLFFEYVASKSNGREYTVHQSDVDEIIPNTMEYVLKLIFTYYHFGTENSICKTLILLYSLVSLNSLSVGHLAYLSKKLPDSLPPNFAQLITLRGNKSLPLFITDGFGQLMPFHESVRDAVIRLVQQPLTLIEIIPQQLIGLREQIRRIIRRETDSDVSIANRSKAIYSPSYEKSLLNSMDFYIHRIEKEKQNFGEVSGESIFAYLSTFLEFLESGTSLKIDSSTSKEYIVKLKALLEKTEIKYGDDEPFVLSQIYYIFKLLNLLERPDKSLKNLYLKLMSATNFAIRSGVWYRIEKLLDAKILTPEDVLQLRQYFFDMISMIEADAGHDISQAVLKLIQHGAITTMDQTRFLDLLCDPSEEIRTGSWGYVLPLIIYNIIPREKVIHRRKYFLELFNSSDKDIILTVWYGVVLLVGGGIIKREELPNKDKLFSLLEDPDSEKRRRATITLVELYHVGLLTSSEIKLFIPYFVELLQGPELYMILSAYDNISPEVLLEKPREKDVEFINTLKAQLKSNDYRTRFVAWISLTALFHRRVISSAEIKPFKGNFTEMLKTNDHQIRKNFWLMVPNLALFGVLSIEEIKNYKKYLLEMLDSPNIGIRWLGWNAMLRIVDKKILTPDDMEPYSNKLYDLPLMTRNIRLRDAALRLVRLYEDAVVAY